MWSPGPHHTLTVLFRAGRKTQPSPPVPRHPNGNLALRLTNDVALYYLVEQSTNLPIFSPWSMRLGIGGPEWRVTYDLGLPSAFYRTQWFSLYAPGDLDRGMASTMYGNWTMASTRLIRPTPKSPIPLQA